VPRPGDIVGCGQPIGYGHGPQGRPIADAAIGLLRRSDSLRRDASTDARGKFSFPNLDPGEYRLTAESPGLQILAKTVTVADGGRTENLQCSTLGSQAESITVSADVAGAGLFTSDPAQS
jgi:hypothetical protein